MPVSIELSNLELEAVRKAVFAARQLSAVAAEIGDDILLTADRKLADAQRGGLCSHCGSGTGRGTNGWCEPCDAYQRKYDGRLPSEETIVKRSARRARSSSRPPDRRPTRRAT